ncbi:MAG TPA: Ig-like domain-containing protein, partial [Chloroflexia bacterium]
LTAPSSGAVYLVGATVAIAANASDTDGTVARVEFWVDGGKIGEDTQSPYTYNWTATAGAHGIQARAVDDLGAITTTSSLPITGNVAPTVGLASPANNSVVAIGSTVPMTANANDPDGSIASVEFWVDGIKVGQDASSPYAWNWTATTGVHALQAKAVDDRGARTGSSIVTITGDVLPTAALTSPANGAIYRVGTAVPMAANASDSDGNVVSVEFWVDGAKVADDTSSPYAYNWTATAGPHTLQAKAVDNVNGRGGSGTVGITGNIGPKVTLTSPADGTRYSATDTVSMTATASDADGTITRVEFWVDGVDVGNDTSSPYAWTWAPTIGDHTVQAKTQDNNGARTGAPIITIHVAAAPITRTYTYNAYQELCGVDEPETGTTLMGYDAAGNLAWSASGLPSGTACDLEGDTAAILARKAARTYDARNRISTLSFPDLNGNQSWSYTPDGLPASVTTYNDGGASSVVNSYLYNKRRLPVSETQQVDSLTSSVGYGYDVNGHLSALTYPDNLTVAYAPNALGQPTQAGSYATGVTYYPNGAIEQFTYGNGIVHTLTQNARGLPDRSQDLNGTTSVHDDSYDYDQVGNVLAISDAVSGNRGDRDMVYDDLNRLTSATSPMFGTATYTYDVVDNLRHVTVTGGTQPRDQDYCYDAANRLTNIKTADATYCGGATVVGLGYDVQGNLANKSGVTYTFDYGNRMRAGGPETYRYDVQGRRVRSNSSAGLIYSLYAQSGQLLFQRDERSGKRRQYVYLGGSLVAESDVPLAGGTATVTYQHTDALGTPVAITNSSRTVTERREYEPYGYQTTPALQDGPNYTGHVADAATGLIYMQARYCDPMIGRCLSVDPVTAYGSGDTRFFNRYAYAFNSPYSFKDPDGRDPKTLDDPRRPIPPPTGPFPCTEDCNPPPPPPQQQSKPPCSEACMRLRYTSSHGGSKSQANSAIQNHQSQSQHGASGSWSAGAEGSWGGNQNQGAKYGIAFGAIGGGVAGSWVVAGLLAPETGGASVGVEFLTLLFELGEPTATIVGAGGLPGAAVGATAGATAGTVIDQSNDDDKDK